MMLALNDSRWSHWWVSVYTVYTVLHWFRLCFRLGHSLRKQSQQQGLSVLAESVGLDSIADFSSSPPFCFEQLHFHCQIRHAITVYMTRAQFCCCIHCSSSSLLRALWVADLGEATESNPVQSNDFWQFICDGNSAATVGVDQPPSQTLGLDCSIFKLQTEVFLEVAVIGKCKTVRL